MRVSVPANRTDASYPYSQALQARNVESYSSQRRVWLQCSLRTTTTPGVRDVIHRATDPPARRRRSSVRDGRHSNSGPKTSDPGPLMIGRLVLNQLSTQWQCFAGPGIRFTCHPACQLLAYSSRLFCCRRACTPSCCERQYATDLSGDRNTRRCLNES